MSFSKTVRHTCHLPSDVTRMTDDLKWSIVSSATSNTLRCLGGSQAANNATVSLVHLELPKFAVVSTTVGYRPLVDCALPRVSEVRCDVLAWSEIQCRIPTSLDRWCGAGRGWTIFLQRPLLVCSFMHSGRHSTFKLLRPIIDDDRATGCDLLRQVCQRPN